MTEIKAGIYSEDKPQEIFISKFLEVYNASQYKFTISDEFQKEKNFSRPKSTLVNKVNEACLQGFNKYYLDLLIIVRDSDTTDQNTIKKYHEELIGKASSLVTKEKSILVSIPVQCIEHWYLHLEKISNNQFKTKHSDIDAIENKKAKELLYGSQRRYIESDFKEKIENLINESTLRSLRNESNSFSKFYNDFSDIYKV